MFHNLATALLLLAMLQLSACPARRAATAAAQSGRAPSSALEPDPIYSEEVISEVPSYVPELPEPAVPFMPPAWLCADPPLQALFPGNGDVVTLGRLGAFGRQERHADPLDEQEFARWYIYSADGELLEDLPEGVHWWEHYFPDWKARSDAARELGNNSAEYAGYIIFSNLSGTVLEVYDYDGTPMESGFDPLTADFFRMHQLHADELLEFAKGADTPQS